MPCKSCGDPLTSEDIQKRKGWCEECFEEIEHGVVPAALGPTLQSHASHLTPRQAAKLGKTDGG